MRFVNLSPHDVCVLDDDHKIILDLPPEWDTPVPRIEERSTERMRVEGVPIAAPTTKNLRYLPPPQPGVILICSRLLAAEAARQGRADVVCPDTGPQSRVNGCSGAIRGVRRLMSFAPSGLRGHILECEMSKEEV